MVKMYVANPTEQKKEFVYRVKGQDKLRHVHIPALSQAAVSNQEMPQDAIDYIIEQHEKYGFLSADDITSSRNLQGFKGLCYSIDKPVPSSKMSILLHANTNMLDIMGSKARQEAAVVADAHMMRTMEEVARNNKIVDSQGRVPVPDRFSATLQHELKPGDDFRDGTPVNEGFERVANNPLPPKARGGKNRRR